MVVGKTSALFELPVEGAAALAGRTDADAVAAPFGALGVLFQIQDDVLDLYGDKGRGEVGADLRQGKVSALVVEHLALHPRDRRWLFDGLRLPRDETDEAWIGEVIARFRDGGALAAALERIHRLADAARAGLRAEPALGALLGQLADKILEPIAHVL